MISSVNRILFRRSGTLNALTKALSTRRSSYARSRDLLGATPCVLELLPGRPGERVRPNDERRRDVAPPEHLDRPALVHEPVRVHGRGIDVALPEHLLQLLDVHHRVFDAVRVREALQLRHTPLERHLAALEPELGVVPGEQPLGPAARGLAAR